ncbi:MULTISPECIES: aconitate hydratase AcnA [Chryseobacterium]|uniref:Aconitate hydratase n=1 Tax=Chryseobacterium camelliae TaxID=1265445 RepID=A0ABU0TDV6_9FLAO|nr:MULTISPECIES: aconitate hydratase AcnA [Chryseobacterium]MDT3406945.1 aconitate hydratase [Pseudacidovorax intermedius]MDQ1095262.1 aconitate hydratase [Chryseobacterium camelliae]MDQ1099200.1 aconitate hydratase [Chryseobacterium sp. SORGH_AS_1048]MDR6086550.1 aconitate hydratase [Chryseobacterium sp. SORGH_AS_0909]MDR6130920.1 aconitate hydratase [Chryseobacterium sp. SORGH_AS_1175]
MSNDIYTIKKLLNTKNGTFTYYSLAEMQLQGFDIERLPFSIRILLENVLRNFDDFAVTRENIETLLNWQPKSTGKDIPFKPARVLMQDFTGVPAVVDIASLRAEVTRKGKNPDTINPLIPVDLVIDHSVQVDYFGTEYAYDRNMEMEYKRNRERYQFLKWAQKSFSNFNVVPPGMGICHQVNLEYLSKGVLERNGEIFPDTLVGTDSHTPMVNGIGVIGWGVGGIEAEAAILGQPVYFIMPEVIGLKLTGRIPLGSTATDMVLTIAEVLRKYGVVGKFVEVFGSGLDYLTVPDRATIGNMSPEFGCTVTYFPIDDKTLEYMRATNRPEEQVKLVEDYCKANMLWRTNNENITYTDIIELDLSTIEPTVSGPKRPQDKILLKDFKPKFIDLLHSSFGRTYVKPQEQLTRWYSEGGSALPIDHKTDMQPDTKIEGKMEDGMKTVAITQGHEQFILSDGSVVIAAITSCTNTSNPYVMIGAGLVARKAREHGLDVMPWVKTSLAPGSKVVTDYLIKADLLDDFEAMKFHIVGYGCTTCIGNSGPLPPSIAKAIEENEIVAASVLSGNRNFEARIHPQIKMNFLMSPMLVVAYAIAGRVDIDLINEPISYDPNQQPVYLKDIWPSDDEIRSIMQGVLSPTHYAQSYDTIFDGNEIWQELKIPAEKNYVWDEKSTYIKEAPFFKDLPEEPQPLKNIDHAYVLLDLGDSITTDHISPAGSYGENSAAGLYLRNRGVEKADFNSYGSRRGHDEVMVRGTFANVRIKNKLADKEGGYTKFLPTGEEMSVFDASVKYKEAKIPLIVLAGKEYGSGSSRDWAAKGTFLLGIKAVLAESYERIHRSNLVGMGVLPMQYLEGQNAQSLGLSGKEQFTINGLSDDIKPLQELEIIATDSDGHMKKFRVIARLDSQIEIEYYKNEGILQYVLRRFLKKS